MSKALSVAGTRRRFGPLDREPDSTYIHDVQTVEDLVAALQHSSTITLVTGHGGWGTGSDWKIGHGEYSPLISIGDLAPLVGQIPTKMLIVSACHATNAASQWRSLLANDGVLVAVEGPIQVVDAARWLTTLLSALAAYGGKREEPLTAAQLSAAFDTARGCLQLQQGASGIKNRRPAFEPVSLVFRKF
ncbi:hypothetical protein [Nocardia ninae]|nr:hypothetical protein [Nocardia ninae]